MRAAHVRFPGKSDEGNPDSKNGIEVMDLLTELNRAGKTIIMVTHSQHDASYATGRSTSSTGIS